MTTTIRHRHRPEVRIPHILDCALELAGQSNYLSITRDQIATRVGITGSAVAYHFKTMGNLRVALMRHAVEQRDAKVVAQGLIARDPEALQADNMLRHLACVEVVL